LSVSPADAAADHEVKLLSFVGVAFMMIAACLGYWVHSSTRLGRRGRLCVLSLLGLGIVLAPFAVISAYGPLRSKMAHFTLSFFGVMGGFRMIELICGTGPKGFDKSFKHFVIYFASPAEVLFDEKGRLQAAPPGLMAELLLRIAAHMALGTVLLSFGKATDFAPLLGPGTDLGALPFLGFPASLPAVYLQAAFVYCMLATSMLMHRLPTTLLDIGTAEPMRAPLLLSTSIRDFWGRRWNLIIHRLMKRTFFAPLANRSAAARHVGGLLAFVISGLFHEYMWLVVNWPHMCGYTPGQPTLFFLVQFLLCAVEAALADTSLGRACAGLPRPLKTVGVTCLILPMGPLFLRGLHTGGMMAQCAEQGQTLEVLPRGGAAASIGEEMGWPPLDWALVAAAGFLALGYEAWKLRRRVLPAARGASKVCVMLPTSTQPLAGG